MKRIHPILSLALLFSVVGTSAAQKPRSSLPRIPVESYQLPNGLTVLLSVDHSAPVVAVDVEHHVGSKNEEVGRTGFAHLFEHVMFTGSGHVPYGMHDKYTEGVGGSNNGSTNNDKTNFFEQVPSNYLETEIWLESDRMGWLLDALDLAKLNAQRDVVKNERRQSYDNRPYGRVGEIMDAEMYPAGHPYHWPVIGSMTDLSAASESDVKAFYNKWYAPNNAVLVIAGDFDPAQAKAWIKQYFGPIPRGPAITRPVVAASHLDAPKRFVYEDHVALPELFIEWPGSGVQSRDRAALSVMGAIISGDRTQWLTKEFVYDRKWASSISLRPEMNENAGTVGLTVVPIPGVDLTKLESAIDSTINRFRAQGPTAEEMKKATASIEFGAYNRLQSMLGKAITLASGWIYHGDPSWYAKDITETRAVTAADVQRVANKYLGPNRIVLSAVPTGKRDLASHADQSTPITSPFASTQEVGK
ncbi:MAG: pitrilysin family protein [Gemmatimonadaceae bacterium]